MLMIKSISLTGHNAADDVVDLIHLKIKHTHTHKKSRLSSRFTFAALVHEIRVVLIFHRCASLLDTFFLRGAFFFSCDDVNIVLKRFANVTVSCAHVIDKSLAAFLFIHIRGDAIQFVITHELPMNLYFLGFLCMHSFHRV